MVYMGRIILLPKLLDWFFPLSIFFFPLKQFAHRFPFFSLKTKTKNQELLGNNAYFNTNTPGLHLPLVTLVNFLGYRLVAVSLIPIRSGCTFLPPFFSLLLLFSPPPSPSPPLSWSRVNPSIWESRWRKDGQKF